MKADTNDMAEMTKSLCPTPRPGGARHRLGSLYMYAMLAFNMACTCYHAPPNIVIVVNVWFTVNNIEIGHETLCYKK